MDISSISSGSNPYIASARQAQQPDPTRETKAMEQQPKPQPEEQQKPVVNAQGQKTGTQINVTA